MKLKNVIKNSVFIDIAKKPLEESNVIQTSPGILST